MSLIEDKQKEYREKVLADIEKKNQEKKLKAQEKREKNRDANLSAFSVKHFAHIKASFFTLGINFTILIFHFF